MGRPLGSKDVKPRKIRKVLEPRICPKHGTFQVRTKGFKTAPSGVLKCRLCYNEKMKTYRANNSQVVADTNRRCYERRLPERLFQNAKHRAKRHKVPFSISVNDIQIPEYCPVLGIKLEIGIGVKQFNSPTVDRLIPSLGYVKGNITVISDRANSIKTNATVDQIEAVANWMRQIK